jgi:poly-gamma-glutamate synthesis protein (capsule biosynthesis protein)
VVNYLEKETIKNDVSLINKNIQPDQIIAFVHWGYQYEDLPNSAQKDLFSYFKSLGVNIVIGAHPHVLQPMEWYKSKQDAKESLVVYSLGNFVSHQRTFPRDGGAIFKLVLQKNNKGIISIKDAKYHLTWVYEPIINKKKHYYILSPKDYINKAEYFKNKADYDKMIRFTNHARPLLSTHNKNIYEY